MPDETTDLDDDAERVPPASMSHQIRGLIVAAGVLLLVGVAYVVFKVAPDVFAETAGLTAKARADARQAVITASLALLAGAIGLIGAIYTGRTFALNRATARDARDQALRAHDLDERRRVTEAFARAVDQLGSDKLEVCLGGIYTLESIARDSQAHHPQVVELLSAYIRARASLTDAIDVWELVPGREMPPAIAKPPTTIQAATAVLGRRVLAHDRARRPTVDLGYANLSGASLIGAHFEDAGFRGVHLRGGRGASLRGIHLEDAHLREAHLESASLSEAHLERAVLNDAHLCGARLDRAHMRGASLRNARFDAADLRGADLRDTRCEGGVFHDADLRGAVFDGAVFDGAVFDGAVFDGAVLTGADFTGAQRDPGDLPLVPDSPG